MKITGLLITIVAILVVVSFLFDNEKEYTLPEYDTYVSMSRFGPQNVVTYTGPIELKVKENQVIVELVHQAEINSDIKRLTFRLTDNQEIPFEYLAFNQAQVIRNKQGNIAIQNLKDGSAIALNLQGRLAHYSFDDEVVPTELFGRSSIVLFKNTNPTSDLSDSIECHCVPDDREEVCKAGEPGALSASLSNATRGIEITCAKGLHPCCN